MWVKSRCRNIFLVSILVSKLHNRQKNKTFLLSTSAEIGRSPSKASKMSDRVCFGNPIASLQMKCCKVLRACKSRWRKSHQSSHPSRVEGRTIVLYKSDIVSGLRCSCIYSAKYACPSFLNVSAIFSMWASLNWRKIPRWLYIFNK
jgi:hypothetical protein